MLHSNWITEKHIDFEYQSYLLLAYLDTVEKSFTASKLYPYLPDLIGHQKNLLHLRNEKHQLAAKFPKELTKIDLNELKLKYKSMLRDDEKMNEINSILEYALPKIEHYIDEGNSIYSFVKEKINIYPVGVVPVYAKEGYIILSPFCKGIKKANIFQYCFSLFVSETAIETIHALSLPSGENYKQLFCNIQTRYITTTTLSAANTFENIKTRLIRENPELPNPATFAVESELSFPVNETLLPVAKKLLVKYVIPPMSSGKPNNNSPKE